MTAHAAAGTYLLWARVDAWHGVVATRPCAVIVPERTFRDSQDQRSGRRLVVAEAASWQ
jgi:hypothetical protein